MKPRTAPAPAVPINLSEANQSSEWDDPKATAQALRAASARNASGRRRFVDPTTCDREYSLAEREFMQAMHDYKHRSGRMFPTWSEVLEVLINLGYEKPPESEGPTQPLAKRA
ncbi:hypothetical protein P12x_003500 [Tundrisphaera lichenicola]|uniref:hypothetical protein n=1 Tax=Tundrisphaera lichenicola TaxID=2029860 RepID=UPI003EBDE2CD